jgi:hypothetical protein
MMPKPFTACTVRGAEPEQFFIKWDAAADKGNFMGSTRFFTESEFRAELERLELSEQEIESEIQLARKNSC